MSTHYTMLGVGYAAQRFPYVLRVRGSMQLSPYASTPWIGTVLLVVCQPLLAQQAPSAGSQILQIPAPPVFQVPKPDVQVEPETRQPAVDTETRSVVVKALQVTGARSIAAPDLIRVSGFTPGNAFTLSELRKLAARMTAHYRNLGYLLAQTYLPAQDVTDGVVQLTVVEGQYGQIKIQNRSRLSDSVASSILEGLNRTDAVTQAALERRVLMLSDLPGIGVRSVLSPGTSVGTSDLLVDITPGQRVDGAVEADNQGNRYTGTNRVGANITVNEPTGLGDAATARVLTSGEGLAYARVAYQAQAGKVNLGVAYTSMRYALGGEFASTQSSGTARIQSVFASYPLIRSRNQNLSVQWSMDNKEFADQTGMGSSSTQSDKTSEVRTLGLKGDFRDSVGNGLNNYMLSWTRGHVSLRNPELLALDAISAQSNGMFDKVVYGITRQQEITGSTGLYLSAYGQWASKNLDASEKISIGGAGGVRAFPPGEATGDEGVVLTLESRTRLPSPSESVLGRLQWVCFVDAGEVNLNKYPWEMAGPTSRRRLSGAGMGLNFLGTGNWVLKVSYAFKLGDEAATSAPDASGRFWLQANKVF
jgi:hemolysin activation/secretion protein